MVEVTVRFVVQSPADKLWDPDTFAGLWSERNLRENKASIFFNRICRIGRKI
jgi:hypothetical protein